MEALKTLTKHGIPCGVMLGPIIPGLNSYQIPEILEQAGQAGASSAGYTIVRLNGAVEQIFKDWLHKNFPDRAEKVWNQICDCHNGSVNDSRIGVRIRGEGKIAASIQRLFEVSKDRFIKKSSDFEFNCNDFNHRANKVQLSLF